MADTARCDPCGELRRFDSIGTSDDFWHAHRERALRTGFVREPALKIDVREDDSTYWVKADVPGASRKNIHVSVDGNQVSISAKVRRETGESRGETVLRSERYCGRQHRSFVLLHEIDRARAEARYENGVLELTLPKKEEARSRHLDIK